MMETMRGAEVLARCLKQVGTERVYGVIGTSIVGLIDGLYDVRDTVRYLSCRHEQVAASMADAEGRLRRRPGVVVLHSGPGALNAMISVANAAKDCSPMLAICGTIKRRLTGCDGMLELDHVRVFRPLCRAAVRAETVSDIPRAFGVAYQAALTGPGGPAMLEVPEDLWNDRAEVDLSVVPPAIEPPPPPDPAELEALVGRLLGAKRPVLLAGAGIAYARAEDRLRALVEQWRIPVVTTGNGRGVLSELHPLSLGRAGYGGGSPVADEALKRADFILAVGCTISDMTTYEYTWPIVADIVAVNLDRDNDAKKIPLEAIYADAGVFLEQFAAALARSGRQAGAGWIQELEPQRTMWNNLLEGARSNHGTPLSPAYVLDELRQMLPEDVIITVGAGLHLVYAMDFIPCQRPLSYLSAVNFGSMGFGFPAALAAKLVHPARTVVAVLGDGDFMMTVQDLETAVREGIGVKVVILNDRSYRVLAFRQRVQFQGRMYGTEHTNPDFIKLAESFGIPAWRLERPEEVRAGLEAALAEAGPALVEIVADPMDIPPTNLEAALRMSE